MKYLVVLAFIFSFINYTISSSYCYWNSGCPYKYYSSKTLYDSVRGDIRDSIVKLEGCEPVSIWGIYKNGKSYPNTKVVKDMKQAINIKNFVISSYQNGRSSLCAQDVENLQHWKMDAKLFSEDNHITKEGYQEMLGVGKRLKEAFPELLGNIKDGSYTFRPGPGALLKDGIEAIVKGFGVRNLRVEKANTKNDILTPYLTCNKYQNEVYKNPAVYEESNKYLSTSDYLAAKDRIQRRSGIDFTLSDANISAIYDLCRYTWSGIEGKMSPWCALFTTDDLQVLEYAHDLRKYFSRGYGTPMNEIFGGIPLADLLKNFQKSKNGEGKIISLYVTQGTMMNMVYTSLGLFNDNTPLTVANRDRDRKWKSSKLSAFSANIVAVLNRCSGSKDDYNVVFYFNEEPILSICKEGVCSWKEFEDKLTPFLDTTTDFC